VVPGRRYKLAAFAANDVEVSSFTQHEALDAGLNINEIKEALIHVLAYTDFSASFLSLHTLLHHPFIRLHIIGSM